MNDDRTPSRPDASRADAADLRRRAQRHAALADPTRLAIVDTLAMTDAAPSELQARLEIPSNLLAHHLGVLESAGLIARRRSESDRRRSYLRLVRDGLPPDPAAAGLAAHRVVFVCTGNSARSPLAAELWRRRSTIPVTSAGTRPAVDVAPAARAAAARHDLPPLPVAPQPVTGTVRPGDLIVTVCDAAHEHLHDPAALHWSVADPVVTGTDAAFDAALADLARRIDDLASRVAAV